MTAQAQIVGGLLLVAGATAASFAMVLGAVTASLWLCMVAFGSSVLGLFMGIVGTLGYVHRSRHKNH